MITLTSPRRHWCALFKEMIVKKDMVLGYENLPPKAVYVTGPQTEIANGIIQVDFTKDRTKSWVPELQGRGEGFVG